jgi:hypothetical protein
MKFLCLAYGAEEDWKALPKSQQAEYLAQDEAIRNRGALMAAVKTNVVTVRVADGVPRTTPGGVGELPLPLAGFSIIEAPGLEDVVALVADTPCARAKGAIEIRPILFINDEQWRSGA